MRRQDIENLSNLVFGLSLSIVALILIANPPNNPGELVQDLLWFTFSFFVVISVWRSYSAIICEIEEWGPRDIRLNIFLLLFVGMEPYLFNAITFQNSLLPPAEQDIMNNVGTMAFALDIALILYILAIYYHILAKEHARSEKQVHHFKEHRNQRIITGSFFALSALPWLWSIKLGTMELRYVIWLIPLVMLVINSIRISIFAKEEEEDE
ncbi:MAG: TMEM175 family protein [Methanomassiliicoccales archaeon]